jgi:hypothetical protein
MTISRREDGTQSFRQVCGLLPPAKKKNEKKKVGELAHLIILALQRLRKEDQAFKAAGATH